MKRIIIVLATLSFVGCSEHEYREALDLFNAEWETVDRTDRNIRQAKERAARAFAAHDGTTYQEALGIRAGKYATVDPELQKVVDHHFAYIEYLEDERLPIYLERTKRARKLLDEAAEPLGLNVGGITRDDQHR